MPALPAVTYVRIAIIVLTATVAIIGTVNKRPR